ncbi:hypothetical protein C477_22850 [Haloterrigena salina JCM 13891]|uniref:Uncharacterized protein n=1 Tax=Haloterrigena salina JCM 13891 TaxID=1227488 RepID=M0BUK3_9EURY|nr:hypothetical protein C477_22850 [Haloterrigena salina JCM 13891]
MQIPIDNWTTRTDYSFDYSLAVMSSVPLSAAHGTWVGLPFAVVDCDHFRTDSLRPIARPPLESSYPKIRPELDDSAK